MNLAQTQQAFSAWLRTGSSDAGMFDPNALPGVDIYQNNYRSQLASCLEDSFAITRQWIGGEAFHDAVVHHVERVPPSSWTLDAYPRDFPATLALRYPGDPEVAELATLELSLAEIFVGPDADPIEPKHVAQVDWNNATLRFTPSLDLQTMTTNACAIWTELNAERVPPPAEMLADPVALLIWRKAETPLFRILDSTEGRAVLLMRNGLPFQELCELMVDQMGDARAIELVGQWLGQWLADGLIIRVDQEKRVCAGNKTPFF